jgi:hypothetical protein
MQALTIANIGAMIQAGLGTPVDDVTASETDFHWVFREMGIEDQWLLTPGNDVSQIRRAFQVFSQPAVRASQSAAHFGQAVLGEVGGTLAPASLWR